MPGGEVQELLVAILIAMAIAVALRGLKGLFDTHRKARAVMEDYRGGTPLERAAIEREAESKRELRERTRTTTAGRMLVFVLLLGLAVLYFSR